MTVPIEPGAMFAGYRVEDLAGRGGMGVVYRAWDVSLERPVALKLIAPELAQDERFRARFLRESRLAASLDHPSVVPIHEAGERDGQLYLAMRYVEGSDLRSVLGREGTLPPERVVAVLGQIADALDAAHRRGLVHRDVKPANILLDDDEHAYLTDFGITKQLGGASTDTGRMVGTLDYLAPEQIRGEVVDGRTDCYALGCVLYECLSGAPPFRRETEAETLWAHMQEEPAQLHGHPALDPVLQRALAKEMEGRFESCGELLSAASSALGFEPPLRRVRQRRLGRRLVLAGGLLLAMVAAAALVIELTEDAGVAEGVAVVAPDSVAAMDPHSNSVVGQVQVPGGPSLVAAGSRSVWTASESGGTISEIRQRGPRVSRVVPVDVTAVDIAASGNSVWVTDAQRGSLVKVDGAYGSVAYRRRLLPRPPWRGRPGLDVGLGAVWVTDGRSRLLRLDPDDGRVLSAVDLRGPLDDVAVGAGSVWAISGARAQVLEVDPGSGSVLARISISGRPGLSQPAPVALAVGQGAVWVLNGNAPSVSRIDPRLGAVTATIPLGVGSNPTAIAAGAGGVWVALAGDGAVARIDPRSGALRRIPVSGAPTGVTVGFGRVWVAVQPGFRARLADRARAVRVPGAVERPFCTPVEYGGRGRPELLVVSDLPLQVPTSILQPLQFTDAIRYVLGRRGFRAGRFRVGYQSCDDSSVRSRIPTANPWSPATCSRNARAYAGARRVVGVIGLYNSGCAAFAIPILGSSRGGPVAAISGTATSVGLTRDGPGALPGEPQVYYPSGVRNFARVVADDNVQGAAAVAMAKRLGVTSLFVLDDGESYGIGLAETVRGSAGKVGLEVAGSASWGAREESFRRLAGRIERSGADAVFLGGYFFQNGARLIRDLRATLGRDVPLIGPDGFSEYRAVVAGAGAAAEGLVYSVAAFPPDRPPPSGRLFVASFGRAIGGEIDPYSATTAQATEVLLDAIAASDGSRASVTERLLEVRIEDGILGSFGFDRNGDTTAPAVAMYRIEGGKPRVLEVLRPPRRLLR